ncbi:hypothetical protein [Variovorax sp. PBL-H6]|uniref:hypothetical protein n=1 Tax=Variovorax sp. PBL-H6 TaxID=434009 RepID=UPI0013A56186|nr:hypothetical protein [Variovorax sp. PBL-H6]
MNPNTVTRRISINENILVSDLQKFAGNFDNNAKLRGKINKDGTYSLKISTKGHRTGAKDILFDTVKIRRNSARAAIARVAIREGNTDLAKAMKNGMNSSKEFTIGDLKALLPTAAPQQSVEFNLSSKQSLNQAFKTLEFRVTKNKEGNQPITFSNFFKTTKDVIYEISTKSPSAIAKGLKEDGLIEDENLGTMGEADARILNGFIAAENTQASRQEAALKDTEQNKLAKIWKKVQCGIDLIPTKRTPERAHFDKMSYDFSREIAGSELFPVNVGEGILGHGVDIDRSLNLVLIGLGDIVTKINSGTFDLKKIETQIKDLAGEGKLDERLKKLEVGAKLLTNDRYLQTLPKDKRVPLGILGVNMVNLVEMFKKPNGQYQSLRLVLESAKKNPQWFIEWAQGAIGQAAQLPEQLPKPLAEDDSNMSDSQEQISFSDLSDRSSTQLL